MTPGIPGIILGITPKEFLSGIALGFFVGILQDSFWTIFFSISYWTTALETVNFLSWCKITLKITTEIPSEISLKVCSFFYDWSWNSNNDFAITFLRISSRNSSDSFYRNCFKICFRNSSKESSTIFPILSCVSEISSKTCLGIFLEVAPMILVFSYNILEIPP